MDEIKLKPCPFCGAPAELKQITGRWTVKCTKECVGTRIYNDRNKPAEVWNSRAYLNAVEVVRCKDCVHRDREVYVCYRTSIQVDDNDYCSYGKRRAKD